MKVSDFLESRGLKFTGYPEHISVSQIGKWLKCPLSWLFHYTSDATAIYPNRMLLGSAVHKAFELANRMKQNGIHIDDSQMSPLWEASDSEIDSSDIVQFPEVDASLKTQARKIIKNATPIVNDLAPPIFIEKAIDGLSLCGIPLVGYIDIYNDNDEVLDIKVGAKFKTEDQARVDLQLAIYAWAMETRKVGFVSVSSSSGNARVIKTEHEKSDIETFLSYAEWVTSNIHSSVISNDTSGFPPNPNGFWCGDGCSHCLYCPYTMLKNS